MMPRCVKRQRRPHRQHLRRASNLVQAITDADAFVAND
jgi:hypothetical protein